MSKSELLVAEQVERADFSSADICSAKPPAVPEAVKRHRKPPEGRVLQGFHEPPPKSVTVRSFQEYLCADEWVSQPANAPRDWGSRVADSWWRETLFLYASRAADASPLVMAALEHGSPQALALVMHLHGEKLKLDVTTRDRVERAVVEALALRDEEKFRPLGEA